MIVLINPPWIFFPGSNPRLGSVPIHTLTAAAAFKRSGYEVEVIDCMSKNRELRDAGDGILHSGYTDSMIEQNLKDLGKPNLIGISCLWTVQYPSALNVLRICKEVYPDVSVAIGSHHASVYRGKLFADGFDIICIGEVENSTYSIMSAAKVGNVCTITSPVPKELDDLNYPLYESIDLNVYKNDKTPYHGSQTPGGIPIITSRGCPYDCNFCTVKLSMGGKNWRANSPTYVSNHIGYLKHRYGFHHFYFEDDNLLVSRERWIEIMALLEKHDITWETPNGVRLDMLDDELISLAKKSGCVELRVSPETASQKTLDNIIHKRMDLSHLERVAIKCKEEGIRLCAFWVVGIPGETIDDIKNTLKYSTYMQDTYGVIHRISIATPFPETSLYYDCRQNGWLTVDDITPQNLAGATRRKSLIKTPEFSPEDIADLLDKWEAGTLE